MVADLHTGILHSDFGDLELYSLSTCSLLTLHVLFADIN